MRKIKEKLYAFCVAYAEKRVKNAEDAVNRAQEAANNETKSTAGDKHDTARAMMHIEKEQNLKLLSDAKALHQLLKKIPFNSEPTTAMLGSLVVLNSGKFYLSISAGKIIINDVEYYAIAPNSPLGKTVLGKKAGDLFNFNGVDYQVIEVC